MPTANVCLQHKSTFGVHYRTGSPGQLGLRVAGFPGHWVAGSQNVTQFHVCNLPARPRRGIKATATACPSAAPRRRLPEGQQRVARESSGGRQARATDGLPSTETDGVDLIGHRTGAGPPGQMDDTPPNFVCFFIRYRVIFFQCLCDLALPLCIVSMHVTRCVL